MTRKVKEESDDDNDDDDDAIKLLQEHYLTCDRLMIDHCGVLV